VPCVTHLERIRHTTPDVPPNGSLAVGTVWWSCTRPTTCLSWAAECTLRGLTADGTPARCACACVHTCIRDHSPIHRECERPYMQEVVGVCGSAGGGVCAQHCGDHIIQGTIVPVSFHGQKGAEVSAMQSTKSILVRRTNSLARHSNPLQSLHTQIRLRCKHKGHATGKTMRA
jgi:hypothetical protein